MPYKRLLGEGRIRRHRTNRQEIASLFQVVERDLADAAITALSADRRFATAYNAALQVATAVMYSEGYRAHGIGHHSTTFEFLKEAMGPDIASLADYFGDCRRKRNRADYIGVGYISMTEAEDLLREAREFTAQAQAWIETHHPELREDKDQL
jgi:uncharacterized protein (UPF0332 family)